MSDTNPLPFEYNDQTEGEDDLHGLTADLLGEAVLFGTDWTTETIVRQIEKGNIQLNPSFQRRDAWDDSRKSHFIESLILGFPIPQLVLAEDRRRKGTYIVLDGKQRLLSIRQFVAADDDPDFPTLKLRKLEIRADLNGKSYAELQSDSSHAEDLSLFENQPIRTVIIRNWKKDEYLYTVFLRLNTGSVSLAPQELRQALQPGPFVDFVDEESASNTTMRDIFGKDEPDFRMRDAELLVRYFAFRNFLPDYSGMLKQFLDQTCQIFNRDWVQAEETLRKQLQDLADTHDVLKAEFDVDMPYRKWNGEQYERRFNRAIFDVFAVVLASGSVRAELREKPGILERVFKDLCSNDEAFISSIEQTTKSLGATYSRLSRFAARLRQELSAGVPRFELKDNRIQFG